MRGKQNRLSPIYFYYMIEYFLDSSYLTQFIEYDKISLII